MMRRLNLRSFVLGTVAGTEPVRGPRSLNNPCAVMLDRAGNVIFADTGNSVARVIAARNAVLYREEYARGIRMWSAAARSARRSRVKATEALALPGRRVRGRPR
jgi:hypothetical protein